MKKAFLILSVLLFVLTALNSAVIRGFFGYLNSPVSTRAEISGKDGPLTVTAAQTILNKYAILASNAPAGSGSITITDPGGANGLAPSMLTPGDLILIIQMAGASIDISNSPNYGLLTNLNNAGKYEFVTVNAVNGNVITLNPPCGGLQNSYTAAGHVQVIRVPQYTSLTVNAGASITAPPWDGNIGGIVAIHVETNAVLNGDIDVSGRGFRGGALSAAGGGGLRTDYVTDQQDYGAEKGEGIAGYGMEYEALGGRYARGAAANAGGGGTAHNTGGGGGANGSNNNNWNGQGIMDGAITGAAAWQLDPGFIANGNALTNSSGGGRGGYSYSINNGNALVDGPGSQAWGGDLRREVGGLGGRPIPQDVTGRIFFGGGGGSGAQNDDAGGGGGNAGGLIYLIGKSVTGTGTLKANGNKGGDTRNTNRDGSGGGGAGGSVVVYAQTLSGISAQANGGNGGSQSPPTSPAVATEAEGPGGGGGGGFIAYSGGSITAQVNGGAGGSTLSPSMTEFPSNGATRGASGLISSVIPRIPFCSTDTDLSITKTINTNSIVAGQQAVYTIVARNNGPNPIFGAAIVDNLPSAFQLNTISWTCTASQGSRCFANNGTGNINTKVDLLVSGTATFQLTAVLSPSATSGAVTNTATIAMPDGSRDTNPDNNTSSVTTPVLVNSDVRVVKTASKTSSLPGDNLTYTLTVTNLGPSDATGVTVTDNLMSGLVLTNVSSTQGTCSGTQNITCNIGSLGTTSPSNTAVITIIVNIPANFPLGNLANTAVVSSTSNDANPDNNTSTVTIPVVNSDVRIVKTASKTSSRPGDDLTYTLTVTNLGPSDATGVTVTDNLAAGLSLTNVSSTQGTCSGTQNITCNIGNMGTTAPSNTVIITIAVKIDANFQGVTVANTAVVSSTSNDSNPGNNTSTVTIPVVNSDLRIVKTASKTSSRPGDDLTYTLTVTNLGPSDATGVTVTDNLAAGLSLTNVSSTQGTCSGTQNITCNIGNMGTTAPSNTVVITIVVSIPANFPTGNLVNTAVVSSTSNDSTPGNNTSTVTIPVVNSDVRIVKTASKTSSRPGDDLTYTLTVTNLGPSDATGVTVTDNLAAGLSLTNVSSTQGTCSGTQNITCNIGNMGTTAPSNTVVITIVVSIPANFPTGNLVNTAVVSSTSNDSTPGNNTSTVTIPVVNSDVRIVKTASKTSSRPGDDLTYTLTVTNLGPSDATGVTVTDNLAAGLSLTNVSSTQGTCSGTQNITCNIGNMGTTAPSNTVVITIVVSIPANFPTGNLVNTAVVSSTSNDSNPDNNSSTVTVPVVNSDVRIVKTASKTSSRPGDDLTYMLTVTNLGPSDATGVTVTDNLAAGLSLTNVSSTQGTCSGTQNITCNIGNMGTAAPSNTVIITIAVKIDTNFQGVTVANTAVVSSTSNDSTPGNNSSTVTVPVINSDVRIVKTASKSSLIAGEELTYTLTVTNLGPSDAIGVKVNDELPSGLTLRSITTSKGSCSGTQSIACDIGDLTASAPSNTAIITINITVPASFSAGSLANIAVVTSTSNDSNPGNNSSTVNTPVTRNSDVRITKATSKNVVRAGDDLTFMLTVTNLGPSDATGVTVTDTLPAGLTVRNITTNRGTCSGTQTITCNIGDLTTTAPSNSATITIAVNVPTSFPVGTMTNTAVVSSTSPDSNSGNNTSSVNVTVNPPPSANFRTVDVTIRNSPLDICVDSGTVINIEVRLTNTGDGVQQNNPGPEFIAMLPVQLTAINNSCSATGGSCSVTSTQIEWNGTVAVGQTIRINYQVKVKSGITVGTRMCTDFVINYDTNSDGANDATTMLNNCITANCTPPPCEGDNCGPTIGTPFPPETPSSDLKPGSILIFPIYTSDPSIGSRQNTRINLTNTDQLRPAFVHLFFVDGTTCSVADNYICLTPNQTTSFLASDLDPGVTGYIIAVAVDSLGYPASFNYLIGDSYIKLSSGHSANLAAESVWALNIPAWNLTSSTATINLNGTQYSQLGRVVAADNLPSTEDGNSTLLVLDRIGGDMTNVADNIGSLFGLVYNDVENSFSFTTNQQSCQIRLPLSSSFPRSTPRYNQIIPAGRTGWIKFALQNEGALLGATINNNVNPNGFRGGHSLHKITLGTTSLTIPIVIPPCQ